MERDNITKGVLVAIERLVLTLVLVSVMIVGLIIFVWMRPDISWIVSASEKEQVTTKIETIKIPEKSKIFFKPADPNDIADSTLKNSVLYGRELITHTALYFGPKGSVKPIANGMNCQNCHLEAGTKPFGNNYFVTAANYPRFRARSGTIEDLPQRINDCFERSLNGKPIETNSYEMQSIVNYINYLGKSVAKGETPEGSGIAELAYLDRAADPVKGKELYAAKCKNCHLENGEGVWNETTNQYTFPPLWGNHSYNNGAGLYRMSRFAGYVKYNMPLGASIDNPILSDEEAWDIAAFVNSQPRPKKDLSKDWPDISKKPIDHPFGPFADGFSEQQHKYGPFQPIAEYRNKLTSK